MATKKRKKKPPGGLAGAPPRSEPRVQVFTKFAGCNFQLANRDFDFLFDEDQDSQTDLMPMQMTIQNNAAVAPFGGIETRNNIVKLFNAPQYRKFTGIATLIGNRIYTACDDASIHHGVLPDGTSEFTDPAPLLDQVYTEEGPWESYRENVQDAPAVSPWIDFVCPQGGSLTSVTFDLTIPALYYTNLAIWRNYGTATELLLSTTMGSSSNNGARQTVVVDITGITIQDDDTISVETTPWYASAATIHSVSLAVKAPPYTGSLDSVVTTNDQNASSFSNLVQRPLGPGTVTVTTGTPEVVINQNQGWADTNVSSSSPARTQTFKVPKNGKIRSIYVYGHSHSSNPNLKISLLRHNTEIASAVTTDIGYTDDWIWALTPCDVVANETLTIKLTSTSSSGLTLKRSTSNPYPHGSADYYYDDLLFQVVMEGGTTRSFTASFEMTRSAMFVKAQYFLDYKTPTTSTARVRVYHGTDLLHDGVYKRNMPINIAHEVLAGSTISMLVETTAAVNTESWSADFWDAVKDNTWTYLGYADDKLVGMTANNQLWTGQNGDFVLESPLSIPKPAAPIVGASTTATHVETVNSATMQFGTTAGAGWYRLGLCYAYLNQYGPTEVSDIVTFYTNQPLVTWTAAMGATITGYAPQGYDISAVDLFFLVEEATVPAFLGRVNIPADTPNSSTPKEWTFNWAGFKTDASMWTVGNLTVPTENYTTGVTARKMAVLDGQLYFWDNPDHPYRIWIGGNPGNRWSVSPGTGGGFVDCEPGVGTAVTDVLKFKTQQGAAIVTALADNVNSQKESRFNLVESNLGLSDEQSAKGWMAEKIAGTVGGKSSHGAVVAGDGLYAISRYGLAITTLTMEYNSQLQVMYVSDPIAPVFTKQYGNQLSSAVLFSVNGILYMTFGKGDTTLDNVIFCYDIALKAWWTYTLEVDSPILNMINIDYEGTREGIGIITENSIYLLPTTLEDPNNVAPVHETLIESGELTTMQPIQSMSHLTQLEFRFDYFMGEMDITVDMIDQFGRHIEVKKRVNHESLQHQLTERIRIDKVVESYKITMRGKCKMRMTHFISKSYPKSNRVGMLGGFDSGQKSNSPHIIQRTFKDYNDLKDAIIP